MPVAKIFNSMKDCMVKVNLTHTSIFQVSSLEAAKVTSVLSIFPNTSLLKNMCVYMCTTYTFILYIIYL